MWTKNIYFSKHLQPHILSLIPFDYGSSLRLKLRSHRVHATRVELSALSIGYATSSKRYPTYVSESWNIKRNPSTRQIPSSRIWWVSFTSMLFRNRTGYSVLGSIIIKCMNTYCFMLLALRGTPKSIYYSQHYQLYMSGLEKLTYTIH